MSKFWQTLLKPRAWIVQFLMIAALVAFVTLGYLGFLDPIRTFLDSDPLSFTIGGTRLSVYTVLKAIFTVIILLWVVGLITDFIANRIRSISSIRTSTKSLMVKIMQIAVYFIGFLIGLDIVGIDLTALAVFSGALGIGIGFGLQKITSNFISGLILLFEKSIEQGDLVELADGTLGFIKQTNARFTLIETFDGKEIMIPNEDFITSQVTNWTYSNTKGRVEINIGVSYDSDIELARELMLEAAKEHPRCITNPEPVCFLNEFADSSVNFQLFFWVSDVSIGRLEPKSDVMRSIWRKLKENKIGIPYPQRDIHIKNPESLR